MKRAAVPILIIAVLIAGGLIWFQQHKSGEAPPPADKPPDEAATTVSHDEHGNAIIHMDDDAQGDAGIVVGNPDSGQWSPEVKGFGRVLDPTPLAILVNELATDEAAATLSAQEYERQKTLSGETNTSARALQTADAAARHDRLAIESVRDQIALAWGKAVADKEDLSALAKSLVAREVVLVRVDLPAGEALSTTPFGARIVTLSGKTLEAKYFGGVPAVDPQTQGQGYVFVVQANQTNAMMPAIGEALTAWLKVPGEPLAGVIIPRNSVVRSEGSGWVYVMNKGAESFTRTKIPLDRPTDDGWFVMGIVKTDDYICTTGAQTLLSEELKAALSPD